MADHIVSEVTDLQGRRELALGVTGFKSLFGEVDKIALRWDALDDDADENADGRDYAAMVDAAEASITENFVNASPARREGYMRALVDLLCINVEGCVMDDSSAWNPLRVTAAAFSRRQRTSVGRNER
jgi:hypothetical protein